MWFLGAPDYLCETNSFISVIVDSNGDWTVGQADEPNWAGSRRLAGVPTYFQYSPDFGYFVTTAWQVEGPGNFLYYSSDSVAWTSIDLPEAASKLDEYDCCYAPLIRRLCLAESGSLYVTYEEDDVFHGSVWSASVAEQTFPARADWAQVADLPEEPMWCDASFPGRYVPRSLREKTADGAIFDVSWNWAVRIPGPTE